MSQQVKKLLSRQETGYTGSISGLGRYPGGGGHGNPLQYSCLENPMDSGAWWATAQRVGKSQTQLSNYTYMQHRKNTERKYIHTL